MAAEAENLDARMEAIRLKNEELEKKHKLIMEDEQTAKLGGAIVNLKQGNSDIPKDHPYDKLDLDFDVKDTEKELAKNADSAKPNRRPMPRKEFLDEIPPDPVNFLREDGDNAAPRPEQNQRQQNNKNYRNNRNQNRPERQLSNNEAGRVDSNSGDSPPRPRNQNQQRPRQQQQQRSPPQDGNGPRQQQQQRSPPQDGNAPRKPPQQLRNERRSAPPQNDEHQTGNSQQQPNRQRRPNNRSPNKEGGDIKNITVQVTDGEVRSVKLKSERTFGTGRVGHSRPPPNDNGQKFTVDTFNPDRNDDRQQNDQTRNRNPRNNQNRRNQKPREFQHPTLENMIIPKASVQDRLLKIAKDSEAPTGDGIVNAGN